LKIALVTDTHFGARNDNQNVNDYFYKFYDNIFFPELEKIDVSLSVSRLPMISVIGSSIALQSWVSTYTLSLAIMIPTTRTQTK
jgi:hypothetical protein